jgi:hypothetical protein
VSGVDLVDAMLDCQLFSRRRDGLVIQAGTAETEQFRLGFERQLRGVAFDQRLSLISR